MARASTEVVREKFSEHIISLHSELPWPACSPDLSACGYFLWGNLKAEVYTVTQWTIDDLKITIRKHISSISDNLARQARETHEQGWNSVFTMTDILVMCCSK
jgi:hypothetical protein